MKQMNEVREYNYKKANGLIEPWDCDAEGDPEDEWPASEEELDK